VQQEPYAGPKKRIAVTAFEFKAARGSREVGRGMSDMLSDALFNTNRFIMLEREHIKEVIEEQDFGASGRVKKETAAPIGELEGAEPIIRGSATEFEPNCKGGALLIVAVEGSARKFGAGLSGFARTRYGGMVRVPTLLRGFANTPVEKAISEMVDAAVTHVVEKTPPVYFHEEAPATQPPAR